MPREADSDRQAGTAFKDSSAQRTRPQAHVAMRLPEGSRQGFERHVAKLPIVRSKSFVLPYKSRRQRQPHHDFRRFLNLSHDTVWPDSSRDFPVLIMFSAALSSSSPVRPYSSAAQSSVTGTGCSLTTLPLCVMPMGWPAIDWSSQCVILA